MPSHCGHCFEEATSTCNGCRNIHYCSKECQEADWSAHRSLCKTFAEFKDAPSTEYCRVIFLPPDSTKPRFVWVPKGSDYADFQNLITRNGYYESRKSTCIANEGFGDGEQLDHLIYLGHRDYFMRDEDNKCVATLISEEVATKFRGPLLFHGSAKGRPIHLDCSDLTIALDSLMHYYRRCYVDELLDDSGILNRGSKEPKKVKAVKVHNTPEGVHDFESSQFEQIDLPVRHPMYKSGIKPGSPVGGVDLITSKPSTTLTAKEAAAQVVNIQQIRSPAALLHVTGPASEMNVPPLWRVEPGPVLVSFVKDGRPAHVHKDAIEQGCRAIQEAIREEVALTTASQAGVE